MRLSAGSEKGKEKGQLVPSLVSTWSFSSVSITWTSPHPSSAVIQIFFLLSYRSSFRFELSISVGEFHLPLPLKALSKPPNYKPNITYGEYKRLHCAYFPWYFSIPLTIILQATDPFFNIEVRWFIFIIFKIWCLCCCFLSNLET